MLIEFAYCQLIFVSWVCRCETLVCKLHLNPFVNYTSTYNLPNSLVKSQAHSWLLAPSFLTCWEQHHGHEESHLVGLQAQSSQLLTELKHGVQEGAHAKRPHGGKWVRLPIQEGHRPVFWVEQGTEPHHEHLQGRGGEKSVRLSERQTIFIPSTLQHTEYRDKHTC